MVFTAGWILRRRKKEYPKIIPKFLVSVTG